MLARFGIGFLGRWSFDYLGVLVLILLLAGYDFVSRRRFNQPYLIAATAVIAVQLTAVFVRDLPGWKPWAMMLIGR